MEISCYYKLMVVLLNYHIDQFRKSELALGRLQGFIRNLL
jgi:hypothetical protein